MMGGVSCVFGKGRKDTHIHSESIKGGVPASKKGVGSGQLDYWKLKKDLRVLISIN